MRTKAPGQELASANKAEDLTPPPPTTESEGRPGTVAFSPIAPLRHQTQAQKKWRDVS
jgi:hypothetical protein